MFKSISLSVNNGIEKLFQCTYVDSNDDEYGALLRVSDSTTARKRHLDRHHVPENNEQKGSIQHWKEQAAEVGTRIRSVSV